MKKEYSNPKIRIRKIEPCAMMAGSIIEGGAKESVTTDFDDEPNGSSQSFNW